MTPEQIVSAVQSVGVAVVLCLLMAWFVKYMFDKFMAQMDEEKKAHKEEVNLMKDALANNTIAITRLTDILTTERGK